MRTHPPRLMPPAPCREFRFIIDLSPTLHHFFTQTAQFNPPDDPVTPEEILEGMLTQVTDFDLVVLAMEVLNNVLMQGGQYNGITYEDVANLRRLTPVREALFPGVAAFLTFRPEPTPTEVYQFDVLQDQLSRQLVEFYGKYAAEVRRGARSDVLIWQTLLSICLELAQAVTILSREKQLSPVMMMNYRLEEARVYGEPPVPYTYVVLLSTS